MPQSQETCKDPSFPMSLRAFVSQRAVTPQGVRPAALLVEGEQIREVVSPDKIPAHAELQNFGELTILPGLIDSHVHINEPGRTDWEGFATATRAAAAGGYTLLVDMPLNCLPPTTNVAALEAKRAAARGQCRVDWLAWGGVVAGNPCDIEPLANAGAPGFKCFLVHPGIDGFTMVTEEQLRAALPYVARSGLPLLVHAELPGPIGAATERLANAVGTVPRIQVPAAHCASVGQPGAFGVACRARGWAACERRDLSALFIFD